MHVPVHVLVDGLSVQTMKDGLFQHLTRNRTHNDAGFHHRHGIDVVPHHHLSRLLDRGGGIHENHRSAHHITRHRGRLDGALQKLEELVLGLIESQIANRG